MKPSVTMVMPTFNRPQYVPIAIRCFYHQTYPHMELVIVDDGSETLEIPADGRIKYIHLPARTTTGTKRNIGAEAASGDIIANLDDDDWSNAHRIEDEVRRLLVTRKAVTGYNATINYDEITRLFYKNNGGPPYFASGTSQCYWKAWWKEHPYPDASYGEDSAFARLARLADQLSITDPGKMMIARKHKNNTDVVRIECFQPWPLNYVSDEFFEAIHTQPKGLEYMRHKHICTAQCIADAKEQAERPLSDYGYKLASFPEIQLR